MSDLNLKLMQPEEEFTIDAGPGRFAEKRALIILQRYLQNEISVDKAAEEITSMLPNMNDKSRRAEIGHLSFFLVDMARQIPYSHSAQSRLVALINNISHSSKLVKTQGKVDVPYYTMEDFKIYLQEQFPIFTFVDPGEPHQISNDINLSAFLARLTQSGFLGTSPSFFLWTMRQTFETEFKIRKDEPKEVLDDFKASGESKEDSDYQDVYDGSVSMAAVWVIFAGQAMYTAIVEAPVREEGKKYDQGTLYDGPTLGLTRWMFWRNAFRVAAEKRASSESARRLAYAASGLMDAIIEGMKF